MSRNAFLRALCVSAISAFRILVLLNAENRRDIIQTVNRIAMGILSWFFSKFHSNAEATPDDPEELVDPYDPFPEPVALPLTDVIDLHTIPPRDVQRVVEEYLNQARAAGFPVARIIHGKGIGVQREIVRTILSRTEFVERWTDAPPEAGGLGATIVVFRSKK